VAAWAFSLMAYGYKIAFGLQGGVSASSAGKDVFRRWIAEHVQASLFPLQMLMLFLTLATGALVCVLSFRFGVRQRRQAQAATDAAADGRDADTAGTANTNLDPTAAATLK
jgi:hypothetical protein